MRVAAASAERLVIGLPTPSQLSFLPQPDTRCIAVGELDASRLQSSSDVGYRLGIVEDNLAETLDRPLLRLAQQRRRRSRAGHSAQGLKTLTPQSAKSAMSRVAMAAPRERPIAAIWASAWGIGRPARRRAAAICAYSRAAALSKGRLGP